MVGCDKMLNSGVKFDACMECGGDGSSCTTVSDAIDTHHLRNGTKFHQYCRLLDYVVPYLYYHVNFYPRRYQNIKYQYSYEDVSERWSNTLCNCRLP